jgi:hypothetical protein
MSMTVHGNGTSSPLETKRSLNENVQVSRRAVAGALALAVLAGHSTSSGASAVEPFRFESLISLDDMSGLLAAKFPLGSPPTALRKAFVEDGGATLIVHPSQTGVEKYLYDINLCNLYIWRWNISADFGVDGHLLQSYVNGEPVFAAGPQKKNADLLAKSGKASILKMKRPRPEATRGETELTFLLLDADSDLKTIDDQVLTGTGPSRADPANMGLVHSYVNVEPWRSIFDFDQAAHIVPYSSDCSLVGTTRDRPTR